MFFSENVGPWICGAVFGRRVWKLLNPALDLLEFTLKSSQTIAWTSVSEIRDFLDTVRVINSNEIVI